MKRFTKDDEAEWNKLLQECRVRNGIPHDGDMLKTTNLVGKELVAKLREAKAEVAALQSSEQDGQETEK